MQRLTLAAALLAVSGAAVAGDFDFNPGSTPQDFALITKDLTGGLNFKSLHPAETNGITGIGVGVTFSYTKTAERQAWQEMTGSDVNFVPVAALKAVKGLPFGFDVGAFYSTVPGASAKLYGAEVRYSIIDGGIATPAVTIRAAYSTVAGVDHFDFETKSVDLAVSKGFTLFTPYAGVGQVWGEAEGKGEFGPNGTRNLGNPDSKETRTYAGLRIGLGLLDITPEYERVGDNDSFSLLLGLSI